MLQDISRGAGKLVSFEKITFTVTTINGDYTKASRSKSSLVGASFKRIEAETYTMIPCVVYVSHLRALLCAMGPMDFLINLSSLHPWQS